MNLISAVVRKEQRNRLFPVSKKEKALVAGEFKEQSNRAVAISLEGRKKDKPALQQTSVTQMSKTSLTSLYPRVFLFVFSDS